MRFEKILVISPSWLGDAVLSHGLIQAIAAHYPDSQIDVVAAGSVVGIYQRMPEIRQIHAFHLKHGQLGLWARYQFGKKLRSQQYTQVFVLPNSWKSGLVPVFAKIPHRIGWLGEMRFGLLNHWHRLVPSDYPKMIDRYLALAQFKHTHVPQTRFYPKLKIDPVAQQELMTKFLLNPNQAPIAVLCPGAAFGPSKAWPPRYYAQLAIRLIESGWQVWLLGGPQEQIAANTIQFLTQNRCQDFVGLTTITQVIDLMALAQVVVSNDSGLMHIAAALNKKIVAIYGSTSEQFAPPLADQVITCYVELNCRPCRKRTCALKHYQCLYGVTPERIYEAVCQLAPSLTHQSCYA